MSLPHVEEMRRDDHLKIPVVLYVPVCERHGILPAGSRYGGVVPWQTVSKITMTSRISYSAMLDSVLCTLEETVEGYIALEE
tara:strand:+ start:904 stop:1149 length:246 start_codon:yes stop_codon:yes gene_type:complete